MSGVVIVGALLAEHPPLTAQVPAVQRKAWRLPQNASLPSIVVTRISRTRLQLLAAQNVWLVTERVQVTVHAGNGIQRDSLLRMTERACADRIGAIGGFTNVAVLLAGGGPDFMDDAASIFMGSTDLRVSFTESA